MGNTYPGVFSQQCFGDILSRCASVSSSVKEGFLEQSYLIRLLGKLDKLIHVKCSE